MPCYHPLEGYQKPSGGITFNRKESNGNFLQVPCGQCIGCRIDRSRQWAVRCVHEAQMHNENTFITLTYAEEPADKSLNVEHFQLFMKRLRKHYAPRKIRYYHCGEYGQDQEDLKRGVTALGRPHYHALLFNCSFEDKEIYKFERDIPLYTSATLAKIWGKGYVTIGDVNIKTAAYVARYVMKKINGSIADEHYTKICKYTGELFNVQPEYTTMSRRPGIGYPWWDKFADDIFPDDFAIIEGKKFKTPQYYLSLLERESPTMYQDLKTKRQKQFAKYADDNTPERRATKEKCKSAQLNHLKRTL